MYETINFKELVQTAGYKSLKDAVMRDINKYQKYNFKKGKQHKACFNPTGCNKETNLCSDGHRPCNKFRWIIDRAHHYSIKLQIPIEIVLKSWEDGRTYWYQNYYQDANQPKLTKVREVQIFNTRADAVSFIESHKFKCPSCGGNSSDPFTCNANPKTCNWKAWGLFRAPKVFVVKENCFIASAFETVEE